MCFKISFIKSRFQEIQSQLVNVKGPSGFTIATTLGVQVKPQCYDNCFICILPPGLLSAREPTVTKVMMQHMLGPRTPPCVMSGQPGLLCNLNNIQVSKCNQF